jgi:hypothetical protein
LPNNFKNDSDFLGESGRSAPHEDQDLELKKQESFAKQALILPILLYKALPKIIKTQKNIPNSLQQFLVSYFVPKIRDGFGCVEIQIIRIWIK